MLMVVDNVQLCSGSQCTLHIWAPGVLVHCVDCVVVCASVCWGGWMVFLSLLSLILCRLVCYIHAFHIAINS